MYSTSFWLIAPFPSWQNVNVSKTTWLMTTWLLVLTQGVPVTVPEAMGTRVKLVVTVWFCAMETV